MPASRTIRRDVILRVPKINVKAKSSSSSNHTVDGIETRGVGGGEGIGSSSHHPRRSMSPVKKSFSQPESSANKGLESTKEEEEGRYEYATQATSAAEWNSLLIWARRQRGPQWDASTGIWQVDQGSSEYYSFGNDPARHTKLSTAEDEEHNVAEGSIKATGEGQGKRVDEGESESHTIGGYNIEDSPPIGPGGRRSRAR